MVAVVPFDWQAHDTAFITAHLHYVLFGGFVFPIFAGLYYWLPHVTGRKRFFRLGRVCLRTCLYRLSRDLSGDALGRTAGPAAAHFDLRTRRRVDHNQPDLVCRQFYPCHRHSHDLDRHVLHALTARRGRRNPWGAGTLEWAMMTPAPAYNFASLPHVTSRDPLLVDPDLVVRLARGEGYLGTPRNGWRETLTVDIASGKPDMHVVYPTNTRLPIIMSAVTGVFFLSLLLKFYWTIPLAVTGVAYLGWQWAWVLGRKDDLDTLPVGHGVNLPNAAMTDRSPGWWGMVFLLTANATFFGSLLFGFAFLWTVAPGWPPPIWFAASPVEMGIGILGAVLGPVAIRRAIQVNRGGGAPMSGLVLALVGALAIGVACAAMMARVPSPDAHAYGATLLVLGGYGLFHAVLGGLMVSFLIARVSRGFASAARRAEFPIVGLWVGYTSVIGVLVLLAGHLPGLVP